MPLPFINDGDSGLVARNKINAGLASLPTFISTRNQIPTLSGLPSIITVSGYYTVGDLGAGAVYTSQDADANSFGAIQDANGIWYRLVTSNGSVNLGELGAVGDGITDNYNTWLALAPLTHKLSGSTINQTVTISITSPAIITLNNHGLQPATPVIFQTTNALPLGLIAGQTYWVTHAGLTQNTFEVSATWPGVFAFPDQARVNTSGSQAGTQSISVLGQGWIDIYIPPGNYISSAIGIPFTRNGCKKVRITGYGAITNNLWWVGESIGGDNGVQNSLNTARFKTQQTSSNQTYLTLVTPSDSSIFNLGQWVILMALDVQGVASFPPNNHYFEYRKITSINSVSGIIGFDSNTRNPYRSTYPTYAPGDAINVFPNGGAAMVAAMNPYWDTETVVSGIYVTETFQMYAICRKLTLIDCYFSGQGPVPSFHKEYTLIRCTLAQSLEVDKLCELVEFKDCNLLSGVQVPSSCVDRIVFDGCDIAYITGTAKLTEIRNCSVGTLSAGPGGAYGASEALLIENSRIISFSLGYGFFANPAILATFNLVENWTFSNGTISKPLTAGPVSWAVPGAKVFVSDFAGRFNNMGSPFAILDVRTDGVNTLIDTTLTTKPVGNSTNSVVTIDIANPALIHWNLHGLTANTPIAFLTTGLLPTGIVTNAVYYVLAAGLGANSFEISTSIGGSPVITGGSQSGTQTAIANPLIYLQHPCPRITIRNSSGSPDIVAMSDGTPEAPCYSYSKRLYASFSGSTGGAGQANVISPYVWGNLISLSVNVITAYAGATNPLTLSITAKAFDGSLLESDLSQTIDLRTAGLRIITPAGTTGSVGIDAISSFGNWISGTVKFEFSGNTSASEVPPLFEVEIKTDQGVTNYQLIQFFDRTAVNVPVLLSNTGTQAA